MKPRTRTRSLTASGGARYGATGTPRAWIQIDGPKPYSRIYWECIDYVDKHRSPLTGRLPPSDLFLRKTTMQPVMISYEHRHQTQGIQNKMSQWPASTIPGQAYNMIPPGGWVSLEGTSTELTAKLLAKSNPFRYEVSVPIMIAEFLEAGSLLKLAANNFASLTGSAHLNWVFGWVPLMNDLKTLYKLTSVIESRIKDFNALLEKGGIRRRVHLAAGGTSGDAQPYVLHSAFGYGTFTGSAKTSFRTKVWGTVRWVPNRLEVVEIEKLTHFNEALKVALDLKAPDLSSIWEMIPFSWLVDYFVNVGDTLQAIENTDLVVPTEICLMRRREVRVDTDFVSGPPTVLPNIKESSGSAGYVLHELKQREVRTGDGVGELLAFGFLSKRQATNLLALLLSLTRFKK